MRLEQRPLIGLLVNPFGLTAKAVELDGDFLRVLRRRGVEVISLQAVSAAPIVRRGLVASRLVVPLADAADIVLKGARGGDIAPFAAHINEAWIRLTLEALESARPRIDRLLVELRGLAKPTFYPAACLMEPLLAEARALDVGLLCKLSQEVVGAEEMEKIAPIRQFTADPKTARDTAIEKFVSAELERWKAFFDTIESQPLTPEQRLAVVVDEDATLVLAGAGSGKTSVIATKASYLVKAKIRAPEEILLLAFGNKAAAEMSARVKKHGVEIEDVHTFHALGNHIIGKVEKSKPVVAAHASDDLALYDLIKNILHDLVHQLAEVSRIIIDWFAQYLVMPKTEWDFESKRKYHAYMEEQDLRTLQGESVKSYEELQIANWLYENSIEYVYEPKYEHKIPADGKREYQPDFKLKESDIYIEHFGVRREKGAEHDMNKWRTAPDVDREKYIEGIEWKRKTHAKYGTHLIETYSDELRNGDWRATLREKLAPHGVIFRPRPEEEIYDHIVEMGRVDKFTRLLGDFLKKFKVGDYDLEDCKEKAKTLNLGKRGQAFLRVFELMYEEYQNRLGKEIDFAEMLSRATKYVESGQYASPFRHILIDEFQDMTQSQARLIKALKAQHPQTRIFAVGDDWQSIFRFAGADIFLMRDFSTQFGGIFYGNAGVYRAVDLGRTFRSVDKIADAARKFVLENPEQIEKQIASDKTTAEPAIKIIFTEGNNDKQKLIQALNKLSIQAEIDGKSASVFLLGRYKSDDLDARDLNKSFKNLTIEFKTIHDSKGLEADHVILLNAESGGSGRRGFPSEINDDTLLSLVSAKEEAHPHSEERRVMYVAMTRARESLTILASKAHPSAFVTELKNDPEYGIAHEDDADEEDHKCGECGGRLLKLKKGERVRYHCEYRLCKNSIQLCPSCKDRIPRRDGKSDTIKCSCGATYPPCPICDEGWLIKREGDHFDPFLSCARFPHCKGKVNLK